MNEGVTGIPGTGLQSLNGNRRGLFLRRNKTSQAGGPPYTVSYALFASEQGRGDHRGRCFES